MAEVTKVGIAEMDTVKAPVRIRTTGLGSCVGVVLYDSRKKLAGMAHVMLPDSSLSKTAALNYAKFADTAVPELYNRLIKLGASRQELMAKMAGGAQMFQFTNGNDMMRIGPRNVEAVKEELVKLGVRIIGEDVGGSNGRTIEFDPVSSELSIKTVNLGTAII